MSKQEQHVHFNHEVVKGLSKDEFIKQQPHLDAKMLSEKYDEIMPPKEAKAEKAK